MANALIALGVKPGDRVATLAWSTHRHFELYFAVTGIGAILHTINPRLHPTTRSSGWPIMPRTACCCTTSPSPTRWPRSLKPDDAREDLRRHDRPSMRTCRRPDPGRDVLVYEDLIAAQTVGDVRLAGAGRADRRRGSATPPARPAIPRACSIRTGLDGAARHGSGAAGRLQPVGPRRGAAVRPDVPRQRLVHALCAPLVGAKLVLPGRQLDGPSICELIEAEGVTFLLGVPTIWVGCGRPSGPDRRDADVGPDHRGGRLGADGGAGRAASRTGWAARCARSGG